MKKRVLTLLAIMLAPASALAVDGVVLINQTAVMAAGGFPYVIRQPGSYKLSGNLTVPAGTDGIDIHSPNVTLDLNGFAIIGSGTTGTGFGVASQFQDITLRNGGINNFPVGVFVTGTGEIADLKASGNGTGVQVIDCAALPANLIPPPACSMGFESSQTGFVIVRTSANLNQSDGFFLFNCTVSDSMAKGNGTTGFTVSGSTLIHNFASSNGFGGMGGVPPLPSLFGSNAVLNNLSGPGFLHFDLLIGAGGSSQGNNQCTKGPC